MAPTVHNKRLSYRLIEKIKIKISLYQISQSSITYTNLNITTKYTCIKPIALDNKKIIKLRIKDEEARARLKALMLSAFRYFVIFRIE